MKQNFIEAFGALKEYVDVRDYRLKIKKTSDFPVDFLLHPCDVKSQGSVGSCVAHAIAETVEYHNKKQDKITEKVSTGFIYGNRRNSASKTSGMYIREALHNTCKYGDVFYKDFVENVEVPEAITLFEKRFDSLKDKAYPNRFSTYFRLNSEEDIKYALMNYGPVVFAIDWYSDITVDADGIIKTTQDKKKISGGHCMMIYGWTPRGWRIQNSWGKNWGKSGRAILPYDIKIKEAWGITDEVTGENPDIKKSIFNTTFLRWLGKLLNWFRNLGRKNGN